MNRATWFATAITITAMGWLPAERLQAQVADTTLYAGVEMCTACHQQQAEAFQATRKGPLFLKHPVTAMQAKGCEGCHGPARAHAESGGETKAGLVTFRAGNRAGIDRDNQVCLSCHQGGNRAHWDGGVHESRGLSCTTCHALHQPKTDRGQLRTASQSETCGNCHQQQRSATQRFAHMPLREGKMECTSCHNPHGSASEKQLVAASVNETCFSCHQEKRGPFAWEHAPVTESCTNCHDPHGSSNAKQLVAAPPRLCQRCHDEQRHPTRPYAGAATSSRFVYGRQCLNCHANVHGSNHPSGATFVR